MNIKLLLRALLCGFFGVLLLYVWRNVLKKESVYEPIINQTTILKGSILFAGVDMFCNYRY